MLYGYIQIAWALIYTLITVGLKLLAGDWNGAWEAIKTGTLMAWDGLKNIFNGAIDFIKGWGGLVLDYLTKPFRDAWDTINGLMNKIKDAVDPKKRHSPSMVDRVQAGVSALNKAWDGLAIPVSSPTMAGLANGVGGSPRAAGGISIDLRGSTISSEADAQMLAETIGDNIIKRLQLNVRF